MGHFFFNMSNFYCDSFVVCSHWPSPAPRTCRVQLREPVWNKKFTIVVNGDELVWNPLLKSIANFLVSVSDLPSVKTPTKLNRKSSTCIMLLETVRYFLVFMVLTEVTYHLYSLELTICLTMKILNNPLLFLFVVGYYIV